VSLRLLRRQRHVQAAGRGSPAAGWRHHRCARARVSNSLLFRRVASFNKKQHLVHNGWVAGARVLHYLDVYRLSARVAEIKFTALALAR
jgi:hypothetical protein